MNSPYLKVDIENYLANPKKYEAREDMYESMGLPSDCIPVGCFDEFQPTEKDDPENLNKAQYSIRDRFGFLSEDDTDY